LIVHQNIWNRLKQDRSKSRKKLTVVATAILGLFSVGVASGVQAPTAYAASTNNCSQTYTIVAGDTLSGIANRYHENWHTLATNNHITNPNRILIGEKLCLSGTNTIVTRTPATKTNTAIHSTKTVPLVFTQTSSAAIQSMISSVFGRYASGAIRIATCESGLNPAATNPYSGAAGLFQIMPGTWRGTSQAGASPYNARANTIAAHDIFVRDGDSWREWTCQP